MTKNLRNLLRSGQGLPLLFPQHEIGFVYNLGADDIQRKEDTKDWSKDTMASPPSLIKGGLFPHMVVQVPESTRKLLPRALISEGKMTTRDLPAQLSTPSKPISFCVLQVTRADAKYSSDICIAEKISSKLQHHHKIPCKSAILYVKDGGKAEDSSSTSSSITLFINKAEWQPLVEHDSVVAIRPDGHIASIAFIDNTNREALEAARDRVLHDMNEYFATS